jgi:pimeloyl-ACP methyl ester carboxylesterase
MANIILVHGAMHGAWCWEQTTPLLSAMGHSVRAIDLPGLGADRTPAESVTAEDWAAAVANAVSAMDGPVVLVGHSLGGTAISQGAERVPDKVCGLIFVSAILIEAGETIISACPEVMEIAERTARQFPDDPGAVAMQLFYGSTDPSVAAAAIARLRPQPSAVVTSPLRVTAERFGRLPRAYIECADDGVVPLGVQRRMQDRLPCRPVVTMAGDHSPFLSAPRVLAAHLDAVAREFAASYS